MSSNVFTAAFIKYGTERYGYSRGAHTNVSRSGQPLVDCSQLVYDGLINAGYQPPYEANGDFSTRTLFNGTDITQAARDSFDVISAADTAQKNGTLQIGDIIMFQSKDGSSQHVGIFFGYDSNGNPIFYGSQTGGGPSVRTIDIGEDPTYWNGKNQEIVGALRPKDSIYDPTKDTTREIQPTVDLPTIIIDAVKDTVCTPADTDGNGLPDYIDAINAKFNNAQLIVSPIVLDLNGDGITTTALQDGILVLDRNGNGTIDTGRELFGSETLLANGQKAANGYIALAELDTNHDGQINAQDAAYTTLKIWKDTNGDGYSSADELYTLADAGVQSIATGYTEVPHIVQQSGTYTRTDGSTGDVANLIISSSYANRHVEGILMVENGNGFMGVDSGYRLANGKIAANAYEVLADFDSNHDGLINAQDAGYGRLQIWKDTDSNGYYDTRLTLAEAGIQSITASILTDASGNAVNQTGTYTRTDPSTSSGQAFSTGATADIWFQTDNTNTIATDWLPETAAVAALPDLQGFGNVYDLHQAILRDSSGHLQDLVQQFSNETNRATRHTLINQLIYAWVGVENIDPASRGYIADARQLYVLEAFLGEGYIQGYGYNAGTPNTGWNAGAYLTGIYNELADSLYSQLMAQTHLKPVLDSIGVTWDATTNQFAWDTSNTVALLQNLYSSDPSNSLGELANVLKLSGDSGTQVLNELRAQGDITASGFAGWLAKMDINNLVGDDSDNILTGTSEGEALYGNGGNDTLDGGAGNDYLQGGEGNDVYLFNLGSGQDGILEMDKTAGNVDTVRFGAGIAAGDISFTRHDYDIVLGINGTTDQLTLQNWGGGDVYRIERFEFADGAVWDAVNDAVFEMRRVG